MLQCPQLQLLRRLAGNSTPLNKMSHWLMGFEWFLDPLSVSKCKFASHLQLLS